ncbi:helix-turn-helix transcriptional regulator [Sphingobium sp. H33]|uniref:Helix-turn-helix transcriptional regulator n=2 Tax=Sphingobium nicotianae TaxID=2782607 RepID=A0A9X1DBV9_9SPHN|nr:helix-turn-helix transcriptional regulator [Sphingobium nicotianae]
MATATGSARGQLIFMGERHLGFNCVTNVSDDYFGDFVAIEGHRPEVNWRVAASGRPLEIIHEHHYDAARAVHTDERYLDHARRFDAEDGAQTVLATGASGLFGLATLRARNDGRTDERARATFGFAAHHALAAVRAQIALESQGAALVRGSLEALRVAAVLIDGNGMVCAVTPGAETVLASNSFKLVGQQLIATAKQDHIALQARIGAAMRGIDFAGPDMWTRIAGAACLVEVTSLPSMRWNFGFRPRLIVTFRFPVPIGRDDAARLAAALPLTQAEAEIVALLAAGLPRTNIAAVRGTSAETVGTQLRAIFGKCEVRREAELVALAVSRLSPR